MEWRETYRVEDDGVFHRAIFECDTLTPKGERIVVELTKCYNPDPNDKKTIPYLWFKHGYTDKVLDTHWSVQTYVYDPEGGCYGRYNPTAKVETYDVRTCEYRQYPNGRRVIDFDWVFEATEEAARRLFAEIERRAFAAPAESERKDANT